MAYYFEKESHTFAEYLLVPGYSDENCIPENVNLETPLLRYKKGEKSKYYLKTPMVSAIMQSVSDDKMAIALAKLGGLSFLYGAQTIEDEANMVRRVKEAKVEMTDTALLDEKGRYLVGAGINTRDFKERVPALIEAGADVLCLDSSEGFSAWQENALKWIRDTYGDTVKVGAGNVVDGDGFRFLADCGADFIKIGIGGGSICITRETKGIGRGQATAVIDVAKARDEYFNEKGIYVPICSDGGIVYDYHITLALAMGSDFVMLGRYFARFDESPSAKVEINGKFFKEYWGEGSARARNWQRYDSGSNNSLTFEEGVDSYVPYEGHINDNVMLTLKKIKSTMCNCGGLSIKDFQDKARLTLVSSASITENGAHDVIVKNKI